MLCSIGFGADAQPFTRHIVDPVPPVNRESGVPPAPLIRLSRVRLQPLKSGISEEQTVECEEESKLNGIDEMEQALCPAVF